MLTWLRSLLFGEQEDWFGTNETAQRTQKYVEAADGNAYKLKVECEKQVDFESGAIDWVPVEGATETLHIDPLDS